MKQKNEEKQCTMLYNMKKESLAWEQHSTALLC